MSLDTAQPAEPSKQRGERTDKSIKRLSNGKGWRARPTLGTDPMTRRQVRLTPAALADWSAALTGKGGKSLAPATKRRAIVRLKSIMAHAKRMRWLTYDPAADLESPEQKAITATAAEDVWTPAQMGKFLDHVAGHRLGGCFALTVLGLRREEVGGLRWSDIDLETGALRIRQARVDVNGRDMIVPTKTDRSARDLPVPPRELATLKAMRAPTCVSAWPWAYPLPLPTCCCRVPTGHPCRCATTAASSPSSARLRDSRRSRWASCGTRTSRGCARRGLLPMWSPPGTGTPSA
jgi:integrase